MDSVGKWAAGPHYGPILTPTDLYVLDVDVQLNPILESKAADFNLLFNISTGQTGGYNPDDRSRDLPFTQKDQPATLPRLTEIMIISKLSPWITVIRSEKGVTMADVCTQLWKNYTDHPITDSEFAALPPRYQDLVRRHAASNAQAGIGYFASPSAQGRLRRCDWLKDKVWLDALYIDERYTTERLGFFAKNIFVMAMNS